MTITATVVADSVSPAGVRLTTMQLRYPRFVHAEFMTHRAFSRNASSSRAIPVERLIADAERDPAMPIFWGKNQAGMQAREEHDSYVWWESPRVGRQWLSRESMWRHAMNEAISIAKALSVAGYHKQIVNRLLEPFSHINVVVTATEWDNFFALRCHPDAQPEMRALAEAMRDARAISEPKPLALKDWHLPYVNIEDALDRRCEHSNGLPDIRPLIKLSVARCARVSYLTHDGKEPSVEADLALYDRLASAVPMHASPMEHQATPDEGAIDDNGHWYWGEPNQHGNFVGWRQYRKIIESEGRSSG